MKRYVLLAMGLTIAAVVSAQRTVTGKVVEKDTQEAVIQATVSLCGSDDKVVANGVTSATGAFSVKAPKNGTYTMKVTYVGFKTYTKKITIEKEQNVSLGTIQLAPDAIMLKGATVTAHASKVVLKKDTFVYNADAFRTPEGSVVEELVRKLPGAQVSDDGKITINGKEVKKILIDGKEFMTGDTETAMKNLPTSIVERVKAYDMKSDLSRVSGIEDGEEETVLDFGIRRGMNRGTMFNADLAGGTHHRYAGRLFGGYQSSDLKIFAMANANNVNDMGFPGGGGGRFGGGRQGLNTTKMTGVNLNYEKKNRLKADLSVRWNHRNGDATINRSTENFISSTLSTFGNSWGRDLTRSNRWNIRGRLEWTPDSLWNIMLRPELSYNSNDGLSQSEDATFDEDPYKYVTNPLLSIEELVAMNLVKNHGLSNGITYSDSKSVGGTLQVNRRLSSKGRNITLRMNGNWGEGDGRSFNNNYVYYYQLLNQEGNDSVYQSNRYNVTPTKNWNYSIRATYSEPIYDRVYLQFSYEYQYKYTKSDRSTYDFSRTGLDFFGVTPVYRGWDHYLALLGGEPIDLYRNDKLSRFSEYSNYIHRTELMLRVVRKAYNLNVGVQVIPQKSHFIQDYQGVHSDVTRTVTNFSPTADIRWKFSNVGQLRFTYRGTTTQPGMSDLLDITDDSNPLNIRQGNPGLKPAFTQSVRLFYNNYYQKHQRSVMAHLNFQTTRNSISNKVTYNEQTGGYIARPENINGNWNAFGMLMFNTAIDSAAYYNVNTFTTVNYVNSVGFVSVDKNADAQKSKTRTLSLGERIATSYRNDWLEIELNGALNYTYARSQLQKNNNLSTWTFSYGGSIQLTAPWGTQLSTNLNMNSRRGFNDAAMNTNELIWNAQVSHSFLKGKALTLSLQLYDILQQQSTFSRTVNAMQRSDTEYNAITSYAMLHVIYRLNLFGGKSAREGRRGPEGPEGRRGGFGSPDGRRGGFGGPGGGFGRPRF